MAATSSTSSQSFDIELDIIGQQPPLLSIYTQISLVYPVSDPSQYPTIVSTLEEGLKRLSQTFPWVAGQVKTEGISEGNTGTSKIIPYEETPRLVVKDLRDDSSAPTIEGLRKAGFPLEMFDENVVAPRKTLAIGPGNGPNDPKPVLLLQLNFIKGGLILTVNGQHGAMDMTGQDAIIRLLSKACRNESFTEEEISAMNLDRKTVVPLLENYKVGPELDHQIAKPAPAGDAPPAPAKASWAFFSFTPKALSELKDAATKTLDASSKFVSTDDALSAFIWQSTSRVRLARLDASTPTEFCRAVDMRGPMGVSSTYPGLLQNMTYHDSTVAEIANEPLGATASRLRSELNSDRLRRRTQALATYMHGLPDKSSVSLTADANPSSSIMLSSWAKVGCWEYDFGFGLGKPESVRRPRFEPFESLMYFMPKKPDGEFTASISLRDEDMERLKADEEWTKYAKYIG
ncbi:trichothecene 3-o-acetyltransferase [Fusarium sporotrichioides]|uniref:Trichothecene 3-O-acetyltransferase n=2 Tax=Fusarium sporotrichioides TaxID=5514 RepID=Q96VQ8_FUSSP|nr:trichothecene 3-O-acetyltransferase [Fusarium sporotrichioides]ADQ52714.1 trichothecene 3-O-acetyltransferase [Fusarium sporotrichioides]ADQ52715.1 trichothecene 3-O-acetyltransferase [Fusarium sporotrichioides]RGP74181.1 trichothecene 3-o-acetyltransferase [Fusarium sporotrichioides]